MGYSIIPNFRRPDYKVVKALGELSVALIADTLGRFGCLNSSIKPLSDNMRLAGQALTVQTYRADNLMLHVALELASLGDILVVDAGGIQNTGMWGDLMTQMALKKGVAGIVIDGGGRDKQQIIESGFPVFAKSVSPLGGFKSSPGSVNVQISCAGVAVNPGDIVVGDADGVVIVPIDIAGKTLVAAREIAEKEKQISERIQQGETLFEILKLDENLEKHGLSLYKGEKTKWV